MGVDTHRQYAHNLTPPSSTNYFTTSTTTNPYTITTATTKDTTGTSTTENLIQDITIHQTITTATTDIPPHDLSSHLSSHQTHLHGIYLLAKLIKIPRGVGASGERVGSQ